MAPLKIRYPESLAPEARSLLAHLTDFRWAADAYLAGSAALALYLGHRPIRDLDLMSPVQRLRSIDRRDILEELLESDPACRVETARDGFLYTRMNGGGRSQVLLLPLPPRRLGSGFPRPRGGVTH